MSVTIKKGILAWDEKKKTIAAYIAARALCEIEGMTYYCEKAKEWAEELKTKWGFTDQDLEKLYKK